MWKNPYFKIAFLFLIASTTLLYSISEKKAVESLVAELGEGQMILKKVPSFPFEDIQSSKLMKSTTLIEQNSLLVHFWATWCLPCEEELPELSQFARAFSNSGLSLLLIAMKDDRKKIQKFIKKYNLDQNHILVVDDTDGELAQKFGVFKVPESFYFAAGGRTLRKFVGVQKWESESIMNFFKGLVKN